MYQSEQEGDGHLSEESVKQIIVSASSSLVLSKTDTLNALIAMYWKRGMRLEVPFVGTIMNEADLQKLVRTVNYLREDLHIALQEIQKLKERLDDYENQFNRQGNPSQEEASPPE